MPKDFYLKFSGFAKLDSKTLMEYFGPDSSVESVITIQEWSYLDEATQQFYVIQELPSALKNASELDYDQIDIRVAKVK